MRLLLRDLWNDGYKWWGLLAPFLSVGVSILGALGRLPIKDADIIPWALFPILIWLGFAYFKRRDAYYAVTQEVLDETKEMNLHQFLEYVGLTIGDKSDAGAQKAEEALNRLREFANTGHISVFGKRVDTGSPNQNNDYKLARIIDSGYWDKAYFYALDALRTNDPQAIRTVPNADVEGALTTDEVFDCIYVSRIGVKQNFKRKQYR